MHSPFGERIGQVLHEMPTGSFLDAGPDRCRGTLPVNGLSLSFLTATLAVPFIARYVSDGAMKMFAYSLLARGRSPILIPALH